MSDLLIDAQHRPAVLLYVELETGMSSDHQWFGCGSKKMRACGHMQVHLASRPGTTAGVRVYYSQ
jgi:hypothetical protein